MVADFSFKVYRFSKVSGLKFFWNKPLSVRRGFFSLDPSISPWDLKLSQLSKLRFPRQ